MKYPFCVVVVAASVEMKWNAFYAKLCENSGIWWLVADTCMQTFGHYYNNTASSYSVFLASLLASVRWSRQGRGEREANGRTNRQGKNIIQKENMELSLLLLFQVRYFFRYRYRHIRWRNACNNEKRFSCSFNVICDDGSSKGGGWRGDVDMHIHR